MLMTTCSAFDVSVTYIAMHMDKASCNERLSADPWAQGTPSSVLRMTPFTIADLALYRVDDICRVEACVGLWPAGSCRQRLP